MNKCDVSPYVFPGIRLADFPTAVRTVIKKRGRQYNQTVITDSILKVMNIPFRDIEHKTRKKSIVDARRIYCYQMKNKLDWSLKEIGKSIGGRDHTTVLYSINSYRDLYQTDDTFKNWCNMIEEEIDCRSGDLIIK